MQATIRAALAEVDDPELGIDIVSLGLVRSIDVDDTSVAIELMMTTPTCPLGALITEEAKVAVEKAVGPGFAVSVRLDKAAVWTPDMAAPAVRNRFEAPPVDFTAVIRNAFKRITGAAS
jgi:metal-sulfur cluster biosynthetic enzyme